MTTIVEAHTALSTAVGAVDAIAAPPGVVVFSEGSDLASAGGNQVQWRFRCLCYVGIRSDLQDSTADLAAVTFAKLVILRALSGWSILSVGADFVANLAGGDHLAANIIVSTRVDLS